MQLVDRSQRLSLEPDDHIPLAQARAFGRAAGLDADDLDAALDPEPVKPDDARVQRHVLPRHADRRTPDAAFLYQPRRDELRGVAGDGETDALRGQDDRRVDADDLARAVDQRSAAVAGVERGVCLENVVH